ncbi:MAG: type II secretion system protein [Phycisphaeraceae bacterium]
MGLRFRSARLGAFMGNRKAFTIVELLVVIAIITLLISMLMPALGKARYNARLVECQINMHSQWLPQTVLADDNQGKFWRHNDHSADYIRSNNAADSLWEKIHKGGYLTDGRVTICPVIKSEPGTNVTQGGGYLTYVDAYWNSSDYGPWHSNQPQILTSYLWFANYETGNGTFAYGFSTIYLSTTDGPEPKWPKTMSEATSNRAMITHRISGGPGYANHNLGHRGIGLAISAGELLLGTTDQPVCFADGHVIVRSQVEIQARTLISTGGIGHYFY